MFTIQQIKAAHAKVRSGKDFPAYVQEIKSLGLLNYNFMVTDGRTIYHGTNGLELTGDPVYQQMNISPTASPATVKQIIADHQQCKSDFITFCQLVANAGVEKWVVDTEAMLCTYYDLAGNTMVAEPIPDSGY